jgi:hypothetical protein
MDCGFFLARPRADNEPPTEDGQFAFEFAQQNEMRRVCTDRHNLEVQILYMDWSSSVNFRTFLVHNFHHEKL